MKELAQFIELMIFMYEF